MDEKCEWVLWESERESTTEMDEQCCEWGFGGERQHKRDR